MSKMSPTMTTHCASKIHDVMMWHQEFSWYLKSYELVYKMMSEALGIRPEFYVIGGSAAMIGYGISINRIPHDIDVVVPKAIFKDVVDIISGSQYFTPARGNSSMCWSFAVEVKDADGTKCVVDILAYDEPLKFNHCKVGAVCLQDLQQIIDIKCLWNRPKDIEDIDRIMNYMTK